MALTFASKQHILKYRRLACALALHQASTISAMVVCHVPPHLLSAVDITIIDLDLMCFRMPAPGQEASFGNVYF